MTLIVCAAIAPLIYIIHLISYASISSYKGKYNYVGNYESIVFKVVSVFVGLVIFSAINLINKGEPAKYTMTHFAVLLAVGGVLFIAHIYLTFMFINVYYPRVLSEKLKKLRYKPRRHPETGNMMKLLSEEEEDKYLDEGMQAEENVFSVDYDVWIDEATGKTIIEKYEGHLEAFTCENCGFATMRIIKEEIIEEDEEGNEKVKQKCKCSYCNSEEEKVISAKKADKATQEVLRKQPILMIKLQIQSENSQDSYEFQSLEQTLSFLQQYQQEREGGAEDS